MKKILFFLMLAVTSQSLGNAYARLISISYDKEATKKAGKEPFKITVQSSDALGQVVKKDGSKPGIQNVVFNVDELESFSFIFPWENWDYDQTIKVKVFRGNQLVSEMHLQDRDRVMKFIGITNAETKDISKTRRARIYRSNSSYADKDIDCSFQVSLFVEPDTGRLIIGGVKLVDCDDADQVDRITQ